MPRAAALFFRFIHTRRAAVTLLALSANFHDGCTAEQADGRTLDDAVLGDALPTEGEKHDGEGTSSGGEADQGDVRPQNQAGHLAMMDDAVPSEPPCDDAGSCCPTGTLAVLGTTNADVLSGAALNRCWVALGGNDSVTDNSPSGAHVLLGGDGGDTLNGGIGPAVVAGGAGAEVVNKFETTLLGV